MPRQALTHYIKDNKIDDKIDVIRQQGYCHVPI